MRGPIIDGQNGDHARDGKPAEGWRARPSSPGPDVSAQRPEPGHPDAGPGRNLAERLPDWDLLPPTELLQRHRKTP